MAKKFSINDDDVAMVTALQSKVKSSREEKRKEETPKAFKKPTTDYIRLDLIVRDTVKSKVAYITKEGKNVERPIMIQTERVKVDYKEYVYTMAKLNGVSATEYIQNLIDEDMKANKDKYKKVKKLSRV